jgi:hypothetical protein
MAGSGDSIRAGVTCVWDAAQHRQVEDKTLSPRLPLHAITLPPLAALAKIVLCVLESSPRSAMHARFATLSKIVCVMRVHDAGARCGCTILAFRLRTARLGLSGNCLY